MNQMSQPDNDAGSMGNETCEHECYTVSPDFNTVVCGHGTFVYMLVIFIVANILTHALRCYHREIIYFKQFYLQWAP